MRPLVNIGNIPFDINVLSSLFPGCRHITEKARALVDSGKIIRLKKGLYIASEQESGKPFNRFLISNHIYGPSYVSQSSALRHYGLIPERVHAVQAVTTKHSRDFETSIGFFRYTGCSDEYFHIAFESCCKAKRHHCKRMAGELIESVSSQKLKVLSNNY